MSPLVETMPLIAGQARRLESVNRLISKLAGAILLHNEEFERVWRIANRVYERHCDAEVKMMNRPALEHEEKTALTA